MDENNLFNKSQHGLRAGRLCLSRLLDHFCNILDKLEYGVNVDVIYLDFAKAFDKVDIDTAIEKIKSYGISGKMLKLFEVFLKSRTQCLCKWLLVKMSSSYFWSTPRQCPWTTCFSYHDCGYRQWNRKFPTSLICR